MTNPIRGNGYNIVTIDMGILNCVNEPYLVDVGGKKFILRYKNSAREDDYGKLTLEAMAD